MTRDMDGATWLTVRQIAQRLQVNEQVVRRWIRAGELPAARLGSRKLGYRISEAALAAFVDERTRGNK